MFRRKQWGTVVRTDPGWNISLWLCLLLTLPGFLRGMASASDSPQCYGLSSSEPDEPLKVGRIVGDGPAFFHWDIRDCETAPNDCRTSSTWYVVPGDWVVVTESIPNFLCVEYSKNGSSKRRYSGWIPATRIKLVPTAEETYSQTAWLGTWRSGSTSKIIIRPDGNALHAEGHAWWQGPHSLSPHFGDFGGTSTPTGNLVVFAAPDQGGCRVQLVQIKGMIAAQDNGRCGAINVSFSGFYIRRPHAN